MARDYRLTDVGDIVYMDAVSGVAVTWNGSATFNVWTRGEGEWGNVECFTVYGVRGMRAAQRVADERMRADVAELGEDPAEYAAVSNEEGWQA